MAFLTIILALQVFSGVGLPKCNARIRDRCGSRLHRLMDRLMPSSDQLRLCGHAMQEIHALCGTFGNLRKWVAPQRTSQTQTSKGSGCARTTIVKQLLGIVVDVISARLCMSADICNPSIYHLGAPDPTCRPRREGAQSLPALEQELDASRADASRAAHLEARRVLASRRRFFGRREAAAVGCSMFMTSLKRP